MGAAQRRLEALVGRLRSSGRLVSGRVHGALGLLTSVKEG
jgi:hypothetical protein